MPLLALKSIDCRGSDFLLPIRDELWQGAYFAYVGRMTEEKERKIKMNYYALKHGLDERQEGAVDEEEEEHKGKRKKIKDWVRSHMNEEGLHHHHLQPHESVLSWRELTRTRHMKMKQLRTIKLKVRQVPPSSYVVRWLHPLSLICLQSLPAHPGEALLELVSNSDAPNGDIRARYMNSVNPNVADENDTTRVRQLMTHTTPTRFVCSSRLSLGHPVKL
jgi:hypothetical protein